MHKLLVVAALSLPIVACADMTPTAARAHWYGRGRWRRRGDRRDRRQRGARRWRRRRSRIARWSARRSVGPRATSRVPTGIGGRSPRGVTSRPDNSPRAGKPGPPTSEIAEEVLVGCRQNRPSSPPKPNPSGGARLCRIAGASPASADDRASPGLQPNARLKARLKLEELAKQNSSARIEIDLLVFGSVRIACAAKSR